MTRVMAVSFSRHGQLHYLRASGDFRVGEQVLYPTSGGPEVATVVWPPTEIITDAEIPAVVGRASDSDLQRAARLAAERDAATATVLDLIAAHELGMNVVAVDVLDQPEKLVAVYYLADERVDFRALVSDLARALRTRVDLRQIGARDATRLNGGIGSCGRALCCSTWLTEFEPISVRLARSQAMSANPMQISGACGKLLCCLRFEHEMYADFFTSAPPDGTRVTTADGLGVVVGHNVPSNTVTVLLDEGGTKVYDPEAACAVVEKPRKPRWKLRRGPEEQA